MGLGVVSWGSGIGQSWERDVKGTAGKRSLSKAPGTAPAVAALRCLWAASLPRRQKGDNKRGLPPKKRQ